MSGSFIRRAAPAVLLTGAAVGVVALLDPALGAVATTPVASQATAEAGTSTGSSGSTDSGSTDSGSTDSGATDSGSTDSGAASSGSTDSGSSGSTASGSTGSGSTGSGSSSGTGCDNATEVVGDAASTPWGPVQVAALVADGQVCSVYAVTYPSNDHHSQQINSYAIPVLDAAASADGADFQGVSGATYTSEGYRSSLQSILDQL